MIGLRDPSALDNVPLRERRPRIVELLREPTTSSWDRAQKHAAESTFRFVSDIDLTKMRRGSGRSVISDTQACEPDSGRALNSFVSIAAAAA